MKQITILFILLFILVILLFLVIGLCIYDFVKESREVDRCFIQEPRTKECELVLYKYENRTKHTTTVMPMPVVVR